MTAEENRLVVGSQACILYAELEGCIAMALAFNEAIARGTIHVCAATALKKFNISLQMQFLDCEKESTVQ